MTGYYYIETDSMNDKPQRIQAVMDICCKAGVKPVGCFTGFSDEIVEKMRGEEDGSFWFIHNSDWSAGKAFQVTRWPGNCYAVFFSGAANLCPSENEQFPQIKCLSRSFPSDVTGAPWCFQQLVDAVSAAASGDLNKFKLIDINNPPTAKIREAWLAFDILIQGAFLLLEKRRDIPSDWFDDIRTDLDQCGGWQPSDPGDKSLLLQSRFETLRRSVVEDDAVNPELLTEDLLKKAHDNFKVIVEKL